MAFWHHPYVASPCNSHNALKPMSWPGFGGTGQWWEPLQAAGCEAVVSGHCHSYQRFRRVVKNSANLFNPTASEKGIRQFVVGTAGTPTMTPSARHAQCQVQVVTRGLFELKLYPDRYEWKFSDMSNVVRDSGMQMCRKKVLVA
jgi:acid phosphatase type 7